MEKRECPTEATFLRSDSDSSRLSSGGVVALEAAAGGAAGAAMLHDYHGAGRLVAAPPEACSFFQPAWRELPVALARKSEHGDPGFHVERKEGTMVLPMEDSVELVKSFNEALADYFDLDGRKSSVELKVNATAPCTRRGPPSSSSDYRGVTRHRRTKKWESHIWYNKKQLYLGGFKAAIDAAKAHDIMGLKLKKGLAHTNFEPQGYDKLMRYLEVLSMERVMESLRMCSKGSGPNRVGLKSRTAAKHTRPISLRRYRDQDGFPSQILIPPANHDLDLEPVFPQTSAMSETIRATLLPRSWNGDPRTAGVRIPGGIRSDHCLSLGSMNDYLPLPGNLTGSCEVIDGSQNGMVCKMEGEHTCNPISPMSSHHTDYFTMDIQGNGCIGHHPFDAEGHQSRLSQSTDDKSQILVTIPQTNSDCFMMPMAMAQSRRYDAGPQMESNLQDLLDGGCSPDQSTVSISDNPALVQGPDTVILKVPVIPSKVISFPQVPPAGPTFGSHLQLSSPVSVPIASHEVPQEAAMQYMRIISESSNSPDESNRSLSEAHVGGQHAKLLPVQSSGAGAYAVGVQGRKSGTPSSDTGESASLGDGSY